MDGWKLILYVDICKVIEQAKYLEQPNDKRNNNHDVEDLFDFAIHWDEWIDQPKNHTNDDDNK